LLFASFLLAYHAFTRTTTLRLLKFGLTGLVILIIAAYAVSRSLSYARGPEIVVAQPLNDASIATSIVTIVGHILRADNLSLNGQAVAIDEQGNFSQIVTIFPGVNIETLVATDQFKRNVRKELVLYGTANFPIQKVNTSSKKSTASTTIIK